MRFLLVLVAGSSTRTAAAIILGHDGRADSFNLLRRSTNMVDLRGGLFSAGTEETPSGNSITYNQPWKWKKHRLARNMVSSCDQKDPMNDLDPKVPNETLVTRPGCCKCGSISSSHVGVPCERRKEG